MKPNIGILADVNGEGCTSLWNTYVAAVELGGGVPLILPWTDGEETLSSYVELCHGFLFSGGGDIDPRYYGEEAHPACGTPCPLRDSFELEMFRRIWAAKKPMLGICRGAQVINVALGGSLYQDLPSQAPSPILHRQTEPKDAPSHGVTVLENTPLWDLMGTQTLAGNSFHHQAVKAPGKGLEVMAVAPDGIVEGLWSTEYGYLRAYQWHPERLAPTDEQNRRIFEDFIRACIS